MITILIFAGIIAGLIQYFVDFRGLKLFKPEENNASNILSKKAVNRSNWQLFWKWLKDNWEFFGYLTIGIAGALLTPLINEMVSGNLSGLVPFKEYADCIPDVTKGKTCEIPNLWYQLILLGYGIVFGYSGVRIIRSIGSLINGSIILKQKQQDDRIKELEKKLAGSKLKPPTAPEAALNIYGTLNQDVNPPVTNYFDKTQNEADKRAYYSDIDLHATNALFKSLNSLLEDTHKYKLFYSPSLHVYPIVDRYVDGQLRSIYSGVPFSLQTILTMDAEIDMQRMKEMTKFKRNNLSAEDLESELADLEDRLPYNCEHVVPQSWYNKKEPMRGDLHHLFTCESKCNSFRSNYPYYDFDDYGTNILNIIRDECGKHEGNKFEPEINKGVVARAVLYYLIRYPGTIRTGVGYTFSDIPMLLKWHKDHEVNLYELHRNQSIFRKQGNRNPFIDFPEWADKIDFHEAFENHSLKANKKGDYPVNRLSPLISDSVKVEAVQLPDKKQADANALDDVDALEEYNQLKLFANCIENPTDKPWKKWRPARSLKKLWAQIDALAPARSTKYDGTIGDAAHQNRKSDHNPWVWNESEDKGVVTALDITHDPNKNCDCEALADSLQEYKDERIKYVIWNRKIMNSASINGAPPWAWRTYKGKNPHDKHIHISVKCGQDAYDSDSDWHIKISPIV